MKRIKDVNGAQSCFNMPSTALTSGLLMEFSASLKWFNAINIPLYNHKCDFKLCL